MSRFVYGSLMAPEVQQALLGRVPETHEATVTGFARVSIRNRWYPGLVRVPDEPDSTVNGLLLSGMTNRELAVLDWFEDEAYVAQTVEVTCSREGTMGDDNERCEIETEKEKTENKIATAYVWDDASQIEKETEWRYDLFRDNRLSEYVVMCAEFREDLKNNELPGEE